MYLIVYCPCMSGHYNGWMKSTRAGEMKSPHPLNRRGKRLDQSQPWTGVFQPHRNAAQSRSANHRRRAA